MWIVPMGEKIDEYSRDWPTKMRYLSLVNATHFSLSLFLNPTSFISKKISTTAFVFAEFVFLVLLCSGFLSVKGACTPCFSVFTLPRPLLTIRNIMVWWSSPCSHIVFWQRSSKRQLYVHTSDTAFCSLWSCLKYWMCIYQQKIMITLEYNLKKKRFIKRLF